MNDQTNQKQQQQQAVGKEKPNPSQNPYLAQVLKNHPDLTKDKALEILKALGG